MEKTLRVLYKAPGKASEIREVNNNISALQGLVGGYLEVVRNILPGVTILADEEGMLKKLPFNFMGLVGPIVMIGNSGEDFRSLTGEEVEALSILVG